MIIEISVEKRPKIKREEKTLKKMHLLPLRKNSLKYYIFDRFCSTPNTI